MSKIEPTIQDVLDGMNERFNMVFSKFEKIDQQFDFVNSQLSALRMDIQEVQKTQKADGEVLDEVRDTLEAVSKAVDKDAVTIIDHERRIRTLEKTL